MPGLPRGPMGVHPTWSPGNVNWSQGAGWVGWTPMGPRGRPGISNCAQGQNCGRIIVRPETLRQGMPVSTARIVTTGVTGGQAVAKPDILPSRTGMLPGTPFSSKAALAGRSSAGPGQQANVNGLVTG